ncbi:hypothetical protein SAMN04488084_101424 [Pedobacter antarcticus]|uniref:SsrA-binding protein n=1 Tax=Pedobacter antarcticus TaxID=34086 RepID=A0A1I1ZZE4_9SPHI|nr:hypothetical protein SAMN04488084_101424 [Pedobacter antarcticus]SFE37214.1 hypothetical protein SAMN03003324_00253 [Pedobacter antarcticus]
MKKSIFKFLVRLNNFILPSLYQKDPLKLSNLEKGIIAYRYWALTNSLN